MKKNINNKININEKENKNSNYNNKYLIEIIINNKIKVFKIENNEKI